MVKIFRIFGKIIFMYKNMMDSMKKPVTMESKMMAKKSMPKAGLKGNQSKLDANKNGKIDSEDFKMLRKK